MREVGGFRPGAFGRLSSCRPFNHSGACRLWKQRWLDEGSVVSAIVNAFAALAYGHTDLVLGFGVRARDIVHFLPFFTHFVISERPSIPENGLQWNFFTPPLMERLRIVRELTFRR